MHLTQRILTAWIASSCSFALVAGSAPGLGDLYRLDRLPALRGSLQVASVSSYDRTGGNDDGFSGKFSFVRKDGEGLILADLKGPGVIYRIWTPTPTDDLLEFLFDGEEQPALQLKFRDLFLGNDPDFPRPLVGFGAGGYYSYVPIPFAKGCVVRMRAPKVQFYQINYATFGPDAGIRSFTRQLAQSDAEHRQRACQLWDRSGQDISAFTAPPRAAIQSSRTSVLVQPHSSSLIFQSDQGGRLVGLRFWPAGALSSKARDVLLKISFDGDEPAVLCPLGDFFGHAWGQPAMQSLLLGTSGDTNYCYFPMPFRRSARLEVVSERADPVAFQAEVLSVDVPRTDAEGGFYALWRRENPTRLGEPFTFIDTAGRGHLVGVVLQAQGFESGKTLFFEGDDETLLDGESVIHGTGSEDFFNGGWYDVPDRWEKRISFPLSGCLGYAKHLGRTGAYRFFLTDTPAYSRSLRQTIEHAGEKNSIPTDYCSVAYLYSADRPSATLSPPPLAERAVLDTREILFPAWWQLPIHAWSFEHATLSRKKEKIGAEDIRFLSLTATGQDWFGSHFLSPTCDVPAAGRYAISIEAVKGPGQSKLQLFQNENPVAEPVDLSAEQRAKSGRLLLGTLPLSEGPNNLMFKLVGNKEKSPDFSLDLISVICTRQP